MLLLVKLQAATCNFTKSNAPPWVFSCFLNCINGIKLSKASNMISIAQVTTDFAHDTTSSRSSDFAKAFQEKVIVTIPKRISLITGVSSLVVISSELEVIAISIDKYQHHFNNILRFYILYPVISYFPYLVAFFTNHLNFFLI